MEVTLAAALAVAFLAGGIQRITGRGFALCATPVLVVYGATEGVRLVVVLAGATSLVMLIAMWRLVEWRRAWSLIWPGLLVSPLGALLAFALPEPALLPLVAGAAITLLTSGRGATIKTGGGGRLAQHHERALRAAARELCDGDEVEPPLLRRLGATRLHRPRPHHCAVAGGSQQPPSAAGLLLLSALLGLGAGSLAARRIDTSTRDDVRHRLARGAGGAGARGSRAVRGGVTRPPDEARFGRSNKARVTLAESRRTRQPESLQQGLRRALRTSAAGICRKVPREVGRRERR